MADARFQMIRPFKDTNGRTGTCEIDTDKATAVQAELIVKITADG